MKSNELNKYDNGFFCCGLRIIPRKLIICVLSSLVFFLIAHGFMMMNPSYSHDSLDSIVRNGYKGQIGLGRFGQVAWWAVFGKVTATWWIGIVTVLCIGLSTYLVSEVCKVNRTNTICLIAGILSTNYTISNSVATYMPWVDIYGGALLLAVASVYLSVQYEWGFLFGIPLLIGSLSLYQPYALCVPALAICCLLTKLMADKGKWLRYLVTQAIMFVSSYAFYRLILNAILAVTGISLVAGYNSIAKVGITDSILADPWKEISGTYEFFFKHLFAVFQYMTCSDIWILLFFLSLIVEIVVFWKKYLKGFTCRGICFFLCVVLIPLVFNVQYIISKSAYHILMVFSVYFACLLPILLHEKNAWEDMRTQNKNILRVLTVLRFLAPIITAVFIFANVRYANNIYTGKYLRERATLSVMTRIMSRAEETEGYIPNQTPIVIVGRLDNNPVVGEKNKAFNGPELGDPRSFVSVTYNVNKYLQYYMGYPLLQSDNTVCDLQEVIEMPIYPEEGFAKIVDGKLIVKIAEE